MASSGGQAARHARAPEQLVADRAIDHLVDLRQLRETAVRTGVHAGDELELRLAEVGGDMRMGERRAEARRVRRRGERAVGAHAQALLFDAATKARQRRRRQGVEGHQTA